MDIGEAGITDAKKRAADMGLPNVHFQVGSALDIPFPDSSFDCVIFSGVIQHVERPMRALREIGRVTKPGGMFYSLTYATEGVRWPMIQMLRPIVQRVGFETMDKAVGIAGLPANRRRTYLDDFFVPMIDFYCWERLSDMMKHVGFSKIERWKKGRLDHEETLATYKRDLEGFQSVMHAAAGTQSDHTALLEAAVTVCDACVKYVSDMEKEVKNGVLSEPEAMNLVVGQGHHRVVAWKDNN
jgi:SAM-dependent methyltransferase